MEKKNISDLIEAIQTMRPDSRENIEKFVRGFFDEIRKSLINERFVKVRGLGTFKLIDVSPRESIDVNTGERIEISGHLKVTFTPDSTMKEAVNSPFSHLQAFVINEGTDLNIMSQIDDLKTDANDIPQNESVSMENKESVDTYNSVDEEKSNDMESSIEDFVMVSDSNKTEESVEEESENILQSNVYISENLEHEDILMDNPSKTSVKIPNNAVLDNNPEKVIKEQKEDGEDVCVTDDSYNNGTNKYRWLKITIVVFVGAIMLLGSYIAGYYRVISLNNILSLSEKTEICSIKEIINEDSIQSTITVSENIVNDSVAKKKIIDTPKEVNPITPIILPDPEDEYVIVGIKRVYKLKSGDGLLRIARNEYGENKFVKYIIKLNDFPNPDKIAIDTEIKLPELVKNEKVEYKQKQDSIS